MRESMGFMDAPTDMQQVPSSSFVVEGWVLYPQGAADSLEVHIDDRAAQCRIDRLVRPDVARVYPELAAANSHAGFRARVYAAELPNGTHRVACVARNGPASKVVCQTVIEVRSKFREVIAERFLYGSGLEIGALHGPLPVPDGCSVKYVDRYDVAGLRAQYPELGHAHLVPVDIIDDGETLKAIAPASQDFIIGNHLLEHLQNPIGSLERYMEVLKPGGVLYMAVPDKRRTFDINRPVTSLDHLYRDYREGPAGSYMEHVREWVQCVQRKAGAAVEQGMRWIVEKNYSIHFHVWTPAALLEMLVDIRRRLSFPFDIEAFVVHPQELETILVLRRQP